MAKELTHGSPARLIFFFSLPLLCGNAFQQIYSMVDTIIVGRTLGVEALAAVGCTGGLMFFILGFVIGFTAGLAIITAQRFGAGRRRAVRRSFAVCIVLSSVMTVLLTAVSVAFARPVLHRAAFFHTGAGVGALPVDLPLLIVGIVVLALQLYLDAGVGPVGGGGGKVVSRSRSLFFSLLSPVFAAFWEAMTPCFLGIMPIPSPLFFAGLAARAVYAGKVVLGSASHFRRSAIISPQFW